MQNYSADLERDAELAVLIAMANLPTIRQPLNSATVPPEAAKRLNEAQGSALTMEQARLCVAAAVIRLRASGHIYAPSDPKIFWRRLKW